MTRNIQVLARIALKSCSSTCNCKVIWGGCWWEQEGAGIGDPRDPDRLKGTYLPTLGLSASRTIGLDLSEVCIKDGSIVPSELHTGFLINTASNFKPYIDSLTRFVGKTGLLQ